MFRKKGPRKPLHRSELRDNSKVFYIFDITSEIMAKYQEITMLFVFRNFYAIICFSPHSDVSLSPHSKRR
jgi:hypothetical protein